MRQPPIRKLPPSAIAVTSASGFRRIVRGAAPAPRAESQVETAAAFKKTLHNYLDQTFSCLDQPQRPWFGTALGDGLLVIAPYGITVAEIILPETTEKGLVQESLIPNGPWLLTLSDGTDLPIDNPITKANRSVQAVADKLTAFFGDQKKPAQTSVQGLAVFPDRFNLDVTTDDRFAARGYAGTRVINASALVKVLLRPLQDERLNPDLYREWIYSSVLSNTQDDSIAGTWLDPNEETISKQARAVPLLRRSEHQPPPAPPRRINNITPPPIPTKAAGRISRIAGLSLLAGLAWVGLLGIGSLDRFLSPGLVGHGPEPTDFAPEVPRSQSSFPLPEPQRKEMPRNKKSAGLIEPRVPDNIKDSETPTKEETGALPAIGNNATEDEVSAPTEPPRPEIEDQMDRAIHNHQALEDVLVASNKTAGRRAVIF